VDTTIVTSDGFVDQVHWQVMVALCPKLVKAGQQVSSENGKHCGRKRASLKDGGTQKRQLLLPKHITGPMALLLIECAYGETTLSLNVTNLEEFYEIAVKYEIEYALQVCLNFARTILNVNNCIYMLQLSLKHKHRKLTRAAYSMIKSNFKLILHVNKDFHLLDANQLRQLLLDNALKLNDDEELAWLAIVRWQSRRLMTQNELAHLYNQMVGCHQDVQLVQLMSTAPATNAAATVNLNDDHQGSFGNRPRPAARNNALSRLPLRLTLDFYSPANPIETSIDAHPRRRPRRKHQINNSTSNCSPLRRAAEESAKRLPDGGGCSENDEEFQLYSVIKCLRFMRFKSEAAFDIMQKCEFIKSSEILFQLVGHMRIAYKLRHGLPISDSDRRDVCSKQLQRFQACHESKTKRIMGKFANLLRFQPGRTSYRHSSRGLDESDNQALKHPQRDDADQARNTTNKQMVDREDKLSTKDDFISNDNNGTGKLNENHVDLLLGQRSLDRAELPRVPTSVGLLIGGWQDGRVSKSIWAYDFVSDKWFKLNIRLPEARAFHASCSSPTRGHIYIFGGTNGKTILDSVLKLNLASDVYIATDKQGSNKGHNKGLFGSDKHKLLGGKSKSSTKLVYKFKQLRPMNERRCHLSGVFHSDGRLYALGGHNGTQRLRSGEWYDPNSNQWHPIAEMTIARADAAACSHENKIFIAGGQISDQFIQSSVEFYKSSDNTWTFAAPMIIPRMSFCMTSYKGQLFAIGGTNGLFGGDEAASVTRTVERYNHSSGSWSISAPMTAKRCMFGTMQIGNKLLVMGGHDGRRRLKSCETLRVGHFNGPTPSSLLALGRSIQNRPQQQLLRDEDGGGRRLAQAAPPPYKQVAPTLKEPATTSSAVETAQPIAAGRPRAGQHDDNDDILNQLVNASQQTTTNELLTSIARMLGSQSNPRSAMKWVPRNKLPERRSGFSVVVVHKLKNAKDFTYYGSLKHSRVGTKTNVRDGPATANSTAAATTRRSAKKPSFIRQQSRWQKFKIIKRRKLTRHLKIALIITIVILMM
jgi:hypothetical protein